MKKIILTIIFIILAICQFSSETVAFTKSEVIEITNLEELEDGEEPGSYDIKIDGNDLIEYPSIPCFNENNGRTLENILYNDEGTTSINFLSGDTSNNGDDWEDLQSIVKVALRITLVIAIAAMLSLLIFCAVLIVSSSITNKDLFGPFRLIEGRREKKNKSSSKERKTLRQSVMEKRFIEQWILSVLYLTLILVVMNLVVNLSEVFISATGIYDVEEEEPFVVYVTDADIYGTGAIDFTFETDTIGVLMFESQYNWDDYALKNWTHIIGGILYTVFTWLIYAVFVIRMILIGILEIIAPIVVLINAYMKIRGDRGILGEWFKVFVSLVFLKPVVAFLYYFIAKANSSLIIEYPIYVLAVIIIVVAVMVIFIRQLMKSLNYNKQNNTAKSNY